MVGFPSSRPRRQARCLARPMSAFGMGEGTPMRHWLAAIVICGALAFGVGATSAQGEPPWEYYQKKKQAQPTQKPNFFDQFDRPPQAPQTPYVGAQGAPQPQIPGPAEEQAPDRGRPPHRPQGALVACLAICQTDTAFIAPS